MARVLLVGIDPDLVDFSDPALPPGMVAALIRRGIEQALRDLRDAGHDATHLYIPPDPADLGALTTRLAEEQVDCVTIGGGVRLPPRNLELFEAVLNVVTRARPAPAIGLPGRPDEAVAAVARALRLSHTVS